MLTVRGNSFHKQRHSCPHSFSPGFFRSVISSLFFPFFSLQTPLFSSATEICSKRFEERIRQCPASRGNTDVSAALQIRRNGPWILGPWARRGQLCRVYRRTHAVRAAPRIFKKSTIHHLTPAITMTRPRKNTLDYERHLHDTGELRHRSGGSAWPSNSSLLRNPLCSPSGLNERVLSPVTPVY